MQHLEDSGTPFLYIGRTVLKGQYCQEGLTGRKSWSRISACCLADACM